MVAIYNTNLRIPFNQHKRNDATERGFNFADAASGIVVGLHAAVREPPRSRHEESQ